MRTASFFCISVALHAAALAYPALHNAPDKTAPVVVSIVESDGGGGGGGNSSEGEKAGGVPAAYSAPQEQWKRAPVQNATPPHAAESVVAEAPKAMEPATIAAPGEPVAPPIVETQAQSISAVPVRESAVTVALESGAASSGIAPSGSTGSSGRGTGNGSGVGSSISGGLGSGTGDGNGHGKGSGGSPSINASYNTCARPETPEMARKNRWQGKTTLRVLIDEKGKPTTIEVFESSGFSILDRAAVDNIKQRCLFYPARDGEKSVQSWIRIPVIFPLAANQK
jgi:protein TonB